MPQALAERYARALAEVIGPEGDYRQAFRDLENFASVYKESAELREVFESPAVAPEQKTKVMLAILERLEASSVTTRFFRVLLAHYRMNLLEEIRTAFEEIVNNRLGVVKMKVTSASPLSSKQQQEILGRFGELTQKRVDIEYQVDPNLLGGVLAQIKSTVYDGTVRGYLDRIRKQMEQE